MLDQLQRERHLAGAHQRLEQEKLEQKKKVEHEKKLEKKVYQEKQLVKSKSPEAQAQARAQAESPEKREELAGETSSYVMKTVTDKHRKPIERPARPM